MLINAGIREIFYREGYADRLSEDMLKTARVPLIQFPGKKSGRIPRTEKGFHEMSLLRFV